MIICADDFGMAENIDQAVLELVDQGKLTAVSCAVSHPLCRAESMKQLAERGQNTDLGLHLVLTDEGRPAASTPLASLAARGRFHSFGGLLRRSCLRRLDPAEIRLEIEAQFRLFQKMACRPPNFIDGHLHVHQFPVIRNALLDFLAELPAAQRPYVRNTHMAFAQLLRYGTNLPKNLVIGTPGAAFRRRALRRGLLTNTGFAGVYNYHPGASFASVFGRFLANLSSPNDILMTHPGLEEPWRRGEYEVLRNWKPAAGTANRFVGTGRA